MRQVASDTVTMLLWTWLLAMILAVTGCKESGATDPTVDVPRSTPTTSKPRSDPRFDTCAKAIEAGYGPYEKTDPEYGWYVDRNKDGVVCE